MVVFTRVMLRAAAALLMMLALMPRSAGAQANADGCRAALIARGLKANEISATDPCFTLAAAVMDKATASAWLEPRDVQPSGASNATPAGTAAQSSAVPSVQPTALAAAAFSAVAQDSGTHAITSISLNPATLFSSTGDRAALARFARLADVSVFFPVNSLDENKDGKVDYAGVRARINFTAGSQAGTLIKNVNQKLVALLQSELTLTNTLHALLLKAPDPQKCAQALMGEPSDGDEVAVCGAAPVISVDMSIYDAFRRAAAEAREEADAKYFGLDLRYDYGDPSFGKIRNASATALQGGLAFGRTFNPSAVSATTGLRGRLGTRFVTMRDTAVSDVELDGGLAFETARVMQSQRLELSAGIEFRYGGKRDVNDILRTRYADFRAGITVPLANSSSVALSFSAPLIGGVGPTLSVSGNWQELLAGLLSGR